MKFSRKSRAAEASVEETAAADEAVEPAEPVEGPHDIADVDVENDGVERIDLGGLLLAPVAGLEVRLQADPATNVVQSVVYAGPDGGVEVRAFAAARNEDLARRGGTATEQDGRWGSELLCQLTTTTTDGRVGRQDSRIVGITGPRWFLRVTYLGRPAVSPESSTLCIFSRIAHGDTAPSISTGIDTSASTPRSEPAKPPIDTSSNASTDSESSGWAMIGTTASNPADASTSMQRPSRCGCRSASRPPNQ